MEWRGSDRQWNKLSYSSNQTPSCTWQMLFPQKFVSILLKMKNNVSSQRWDHKCPLVGLHFCMYDVGWPENVLFWFPTKWILFPGHKFVFLMQYVSHCLRYGGTHSTTFFTSHTLVQSRMFLCSPRQRQLKHIWAFNIPIMLFCLWPEAKFLFWLNNSMKNVKILSIISFRFDIVQEYLLILLFFSSFPLDHDTCHICL